MRFFLKKKTRVQRPQAARPRGCSRIPCIPIVQLSSQVYTHHVQNTRKSVPPLDNKRNACNSPPGTLPPTGSTFSASAVVVQQRRGKYMRTHARSSHTDMRNRHSEEVVTMAWRVWRRTFSAACVRRRGGAGEERERGYGQHVHDSSSLQMEVCPFLLAMESAVSPKLFVTSFLAPASSSARAHRS